MKKELIGNIVVAYFIFKDSDIYFLKVDGNEIFSDEVMAVAKISSRITYFRKNINLNEFGYLKYCPSFFRGKARNIKLIGEEVKLKRYGLRGLHRGNFYKVPDG